MLVAGPLRAAPRRRAADQLVGAAGRLAGDERDLLRRCCGAAATLGDDPALRRPRADADGDRACTCATDCARTRDEPQPQLELTAVCSPRRALLAASRQEKTAWTRSRPRLALGSGAQGPHPAADRGGDRHLLQAADPARQDRHPARRARQPPAQEARDAARTSSPAPTSSGSPTSSRAAPPARDRRSRPVASRARDGASTAPSAASSTPTGANYCQKCGAYLGAPEDRPDGVLDGDLPRSTRPASSCRSSSRTSSRDEGAALVIRAGGGRVGESFPLDGDRMTIGRRPDSDVFLDDVTVSRDHALLVRRGDDFHLDDLGSLNGTYVNRHADRVPPPRRRRRAAGRQVQAHLPRAMMALPTTRTPSAERAERDGRRGARAKSMTIGAVCKALEQEFPDISISKIRYLEDQKLLAPRRTPGGYRLYSAGRRRAAAHDPAPAARRVPAAARDPPGARGRPQRRRATSRRPATRRRDGAPARPRGAARAASAPRRAVLARGRARGDAAEAALVAELEEYGVIKGEVRGGREVLRRDRARDHPRGHRARALRRRRAQPARLPHVGRPRGGAAAADPRPGAALAQPRAPQGGARGAREPRRGHHAPQAPAARSATCARSSADAD